MKTIIIITGLILTLLTVSSQAQYLTENKEDHVTLASILDEATKTNEPVTWDLIQMAMALAGDNIVSATLKAGHKEYVSMPKVKNGIMREVLSRLDNLEAGQGGLIHESATETGETSSVPAELSDVKRRVDEIEELIVNPDVKCQDKIIEAMKYRFHKRNGKFKLPRYK